MSAQAGFDRRSHEDVTADVADVPVGSPGSRDRLARLRFGRFLLVGGVAALVNFLSRCLFSLALPYAVSVVSAYCVGMVVAFALNRRYVFADAGNAVHEQALFFVAVNLLGMAQTLLVSLLLADWLLPAIGLRWHVETVAHAIGIGVPVVTSYLGHRHFSFRRRS